MAAPAPWQAVTSSSFPVDGGDAGASYFDSIASPQHSGSLPPQAAPAAATPEAWHSAAHASHEPSYGGSAVPAPGPEHDAGDAAAAPPAAVWTAHADAAGAAAVAHDGGISFFDELPSSPSHGAADTAPYRLPAAAGAPGFPAAALQPTPPPLVSAPPVGQPLPGAAADHDVSFFDSLASPPEQSAAPHQPWPSNAAADRPSSTATDAPHSHWALPPPSQVADYAAAFGAADNDSGDVSFFDTVGSQHAAQVSQLPPNQPPPGAQLGPPQSAPGQGAGGFASPHAVGYSAYAAPGGVQQQLLPPGTHPFADAHRQQSLPDLAYFDGLSSHGSAQPPAEQEQQQQQQLQQHPAAADEDAALMLTPYTTPPLEAQPQSADTTAAAPPSASTFRVLSSEDATSFFDNLGESGSLGVGGPATSSLAPAAVADALPLAPQEQQQQQPQASGATDGVLPGAVATSGGSATDGAAAAEVSAAGPNYATSTDYGVQYGSPAEARGAAYAGDASGNAYGAAADAPEGEAAPQPGYSGADSGYSSHDGAYSYAQDWSQYGYYDEHGQFHYYNAGEGAAAGYPAAADAGATATDVDNTTYPTDASYYYGVPQQQQQQQQQQLPTNYFIPDPSAAGGAATSAQPPADVNQAGVPPHGSSGLHKDVSLATWQGDRKYGMDTSLPVISEQRLSEQQQVPSAYMPYAPSTAPVDYERAPRTAQEARTTPNGRPPHAVLAFGFAGRLVAMQTVAAQYVVPGQDLQDVAMSPGPLQFGTLSALPECMRSAAAAATTSADPELEQLASFPGPLQPGSSSSKDKLLKWLGERIDGCPEGEQEDARVLWGLLRVLVRHGGQLRSQGKQKEDNSGPEAELLGLLVPPPPPAVQPPTADLLGAPSFLPLTPAAGATPLLIPGPPEPALQATAQQVQALLLAGKRRDALRAAVDGQLWAAALLLGVGAGEREMREVVYELARGGLVQGSPLQTLALLMAHRTDLMRAAGAGGVGVGVGGFGGAGVAAFGVPDRPGSFSPGVLPPIVPVPMGATAAGAATVVANAGAAQAGFSFIGGTAAVFPGGVAAGPAACDALLAQWRENVAMVVSNRIPPHDVEALVALGDRLLHELSRVEAAHVCYLLAGVPPLPAADPASKYTLLGADCRDLGSSSGGACSWVTAAAVQRTEILEWARGSAGGGGGEGAVPWLAFQPYKLHYAMLLAEAGKVSEALHYCDAIEKTLTAAAPRGAPPPLVMACGNAMASLRDRLHRHAQAHGIKFKSNESVVAKAGKWFNSTLNNLMWGGDLAARGGAGGGSGPPSPKTGVPRTDSWSTFTTPPDGIAGRLNLRHQRSLSAGEARFFESGGAGSGGGAAGSAASFSVAPPPVQAASWGGPSEDTGMGASFIPQRPAPSSFLPPRVPSVSQTLHGPSPLGASSGLGGADGPALLQSPAVAGLAGQSALPPPEAEAATSRPSTRDSYSDGGGTGGGGGGGSNGTPSKPGRSRSQNLLGAASGLFKGVGSLFGETRRGGGGGSVDDPKLADAADFYYREDLKRWVERGKEHLAVAEAQLAPPPTMAAAAPLAGGAAAAAPLAPRGRGLASRYVNTFSSGPATGTASTTGAPPLVASLLPPTAATVGVLPPGPGLAAPPRPGGFFIPSAPASINPSAATDFSHGGATVNRFSESDAVNLRTPASDSATTSNSQAEPTYGRYSYADVASTPNGPPAAQGQTSPTQRSQPPQPPNAWSAGQSTTPPGGHSPPVHTPYYTPGAQPVSGGGGGSSGSSPAVKLQHATPLGGAGTPYFFTPDPTHGDAAGGAYAAAAATSPRGSGYSHMPPVNVPEAAGPMDLAGAFANSAQEHRTASQQEQHKQQHIQDLAPVTTYEPAAVSYDTLYASTSGTATGGDASGGDGRASLYGGGGNASSGQGAYWGAAAGDGYNSGGQHTSYGDARVESHGPPAQLQQQNLGYATYYEQSYSYYTSSGAYAGEPEQASNEQDELREVQL